MNQEREHIQNIHDPAQVSQPSTARPSDTQAILALIGVLLFAALFAFLIGTIRNRGYQEGVRDAQPPQTVIR